MAEKRQNKWLLQKQHFHCSPAMSKSRSKSSKFALKWFWREAKIFAIHFKELAVFPIYNRALIRRYSPFFENLFYFDIAGEQEKCCF